ncbi:hypothetical protein DUGA2_26240 [Duganella sp. HH101]|nr:hypothetical protein DUGA2_26240 [Duganella sp. HH101]
MAGAAAAQLHRLRTGVQVRLEARDHFTRQGLLDQLFDILQHLVLVHADQRHGFAGGAGAAGTADAVHIVLRNVRQVVVDHVRQLVDVDAARGDIGGHQHLQLVVLELGQRLGARRLALVAVDRHGADAVVAQLFDQLVGAVLGAGEHQHLVPVVGLDQVRQHRVLLVAVDRVDQLGDHFDRRIAARHFDHGGLVQQAVGQGLDLVREGGREQQVLAFRRQRGQHFLDVADEAHVQHAVGFVQDQDFHVRQVDGALFHVVQQAARGGDQDVDAVLELLDLRVDADAAEDHGGVQLGVLAVGAHAFLDLGREFAGRGQDQRADRTGGGVAGDGRAFGVGRQTVQDGQREAGGLAGAGLCACQQVAAIQHRRDGLLLDGGGRGVAGFGNSADNSVGQTEGRE